MRRMLFIAIAILAVMFAGGRASAFEIDGVSVDGEQIVLQTTYGGNISLERGQSAVPQIIELRPYANHAFIRDFLNKKPKFLVSFPKNEDFRAFAAFLKRTSDDAGSCSSSVIGRDLCILYIFF